MAKPGKYFYWNLLIFAFPFIIYINSFQNQFMFGDDQNIILNNVYLKDWKYFPKFFTEHYTAGSGVLYNYWRPFQLAVYSLIVHTAGFRPWAFHFASIIFHSFCGLLIFAIYRKLRRAIDSFAFFALGALVWLALPLAAEELAVTTGLASPLHLFWMLFGVYCFLSFEERKRTIWYILSLSAFIFALFSKESAVIFPGLVLAAHATGIKTGLLKRIKIKGFVYRHIPFWLIAFAYIAARLTILNFDNTLNFYNEPNIFTQHLSYRLYTFFTTFTHGLRIIFLPIGLHPERSWPVFTSLFSIDVLSGFLILSAFLIIAALSWKRNPLFSFGLFWFFFSYLPMSNIVAQINALIWDHWFYAPSAGIAFGVISAAVPLREKFYRRFFIVLLILITTALGAFTFLRNPKWKDTESMSRFILDYEPQAARTWSNLALSISGQGSDDEAIACFLRSIQISDIYPQTHHNLANIYVNLGRYDLAEIQYLQAISLDDKFYNSYIGLGRLYLSEGRLDEAKTYFKKASQIYPYLPREIIEFIEKVADK